MPAYCHIFNRGIEGREIFSDDEDFKIFVEYLAEYLSPARNIDELRKQFTVNGRTYHGIPHLPKNYFGQIELIAYSLHSDHFHLVIHEAEPNNLSKFLRSLFTRYSMYYNKKYKRRGPLYEGPYKSVSIEDITLIPSLVRVIHSHNTNPHEQSSSAWIYLQGKIPKWIKPEIVTSQVKNYTQFANNSEEIQRDKKLLAHLLFENVAGDAVPSPVSASAQTNVTPDTQNDKPSTATLRLPEFLAAAFGLFIVLFVLGFRNVNIYMAIENTNSDLADKTNINNNSNSAVSGISDEQNAIDYDYIEPTTAPAEKAYIIVGVNSTTSNANIREKASMDSKIVMKAKSGDVFEYLGTEEGWHKILLTDGIAYISEEVSIIKDD